MFLWAALAEVVRAETTELLTTDDEWGRLRITTKTGRPFVCVQVMQRHVSVFSLPMGYHPDILPVSLRPRKSGRVTLKFTNENDPLIKEVVILLQNSMTVIDDY
jgi:hypothetical protein